MRILIFTAILLVNSSFAQNKNESVATQLSVIDNGAYVGSKSQIVSKYKIVLSSLTKKFKLKEIEIGDQSAYTKQTLSEEYGIEEAILNIMEGLDEISDNKMGKTKYSECLGYYVLARSKGYTHGQAIYSLRTIFHALKK